MSPLPPKHLFIYVEDDADDRELMKEAFAKYGEQVELITLEDGASALRYFNRLSLADQQPCLIILDINLPIFDGQQVATQVRAMENLSKTPIVFFTTSSQHRDQEFARSQKAGFITKPLTYRQMDAITEQLVDACDQNTQRQIRRPAL